ALSAMRRTAAEVTPGVSTSNTIAASASVPANASSPTRSDEPMPLFQPAFSTRMTSPRSALARTSADAAPSTTTIGAQPPSRTVLTARSPRRLPSKRTNAFGPPYRRPPPAASTRPATLSSALPNRRLRQTRPENIGAAPGRATIDSPVASEHAARPLLLLRPPLPRRLHVAAHVCRMWRDDVEQSVAGGGGPVPSQLPRRSDRPRGGPSGCRAGPRRTGPARRIHRNGRVLETSRNTGAS